MKPLADDDVPTRSTMWEEIRRVKALLERRIAEQMAAAWRNGQVGLNACAGTSSSGSAGTGRDRQRAANHDNGGGQPA